MYIDSHCHINFPELHERMDAVLSAMEDHKVSHALCVSVTLDKFPDILALANHKQHIFASVGVHPDYENITEPTVEDYFRLKGDLTWQRERFRTHIQAAVAANLPLIIHTRQAPEDTIRIMKEEQADKAKGVMHCFTESYEMAKQAMDLGFFISFSGIITFKNAEDLRATVKKIPLENMLIETDSPYLAPVPNRGKMNEPSNVIYVAEKIAEIKNISVEEVAEATTYNFSQLFTKCHLS